MTARGRCARRRGLCALCPRGANQVSGRRDTDQTSPRRSHRKVTSLCSGGAPLPHPLISFLPQQFWLPFSLHFQLKDLNSSSSQGNVIYFIFITVSSTDLFSLSRTSMTRILDPLGIAYTSFFFSFLFLHIFPLPSKATVF